MYNKRNNRDKGTPALHVAAQEGYVETVQELINRGTNVNIKDLDAQTALHIAADKNDVEISRLLIMPGLMLMQKIEKHVIGQRLY
ncbi:MAG: Ankyrin repeat (many copies) [Gammaproteobacteria bacterium]|jgi:ankyrin repeat protein|nr:Ankyrin repeat (many copies) [Gammaproteobacteria bacterium]